MRKILGAAAILGLIAVPSVVVASQAANTGSPYRSFGYQDSCVLDSTSSCTKTHGLGVKPDAVLIQETGPGQNAVVTSTTANTYRVKFNWHDGHLFKVGTKITFYVHFDAPGGGVQPSPTPSPSPSPSPKPTTPAPSPTPPPTPTVPPAGACPKGGTPDFVTTAKPGDYNGAETTYEDHDGSGVYGVHNDMWNNDNGTYTMNACDYDNWFELATQPNTTDGSVKTYPKVKRDYCPGWVTGCDMAPGIPDVQMPLSKIESVRFAHKVDRVPGMIWNVAFDVWINDALSNELMIWTENHNQHPAGGVWNNGVQSPNIPNVTIGGKVYDVYHLPFGQGDHAGGIFTYVSKVPQTSGVMPLELFFKDLQNRKWLKPKAGQTTDTTWQLNYGVEIVDTNNVEHRFNFTDFDIKEVP